MKEGDSCKTTLPLFALLQDEDVVRDSNIYSRKSEM